MKNILALLLIAILLITLSLIFFKEKQTEVERKPTTTSQVKSADFVDIAKQKNQFDMVRFSLFPSFDEVSVITLNFNQESLLIERYQSDKNAGYTKIKSKQVKPSKIFLKSMKAAVVSDFLKSNTPEQADGLDKKIWVIEVTSRGKYYFSSVWSPKNGSEHILGGMLFQQASKYMELGSLY